MTNDPSNRERKLEALLQRTFDGLPGRSAPADLEQRVQAQLLLRAQPWWRRHFALWPAAVRVGLVALCVGLVALTVLAGGRHEYDVSAAGYWIRSFLTFASSAGGFAAVIYRLIPAAWLYAGLLIGAMLYALLFGLGAIAYHALYVQPSNGR